MSDMPRIENGFATVGSGSWLVRRGQPAAVCGAVRMRGLRGFIVPDRGLLQVAEINGVMHASSAVQPFLTQVAVSDGLKAVSSKLLLAPSCARDSGKLVRIIPMSFRKALPVTVLSSGWVVLSTRSRVKRIVIEEDEIATVRSEAAVAWTGRDPTGYCAKLRMRDILFPTGNGAQPALNFYGPQIVWAEGCHEF